MHWLAFAPDNTELEVWMWHWFFISNPSYFWVLFTSTALRDPDRQRYAPIKSTCTLTFICNNGRSISWPSIFNHCCDRVQSAKDSSRWLPPPLISVIAISSPPNMYHDVLCSVRTSRLFDMGIESQCDLPNQQIQCEMDPATHGKWQKSKQQSCTSKQKRWSNDLLTGGVGKIVGGNVDCLQRKWSSHLLSNVWQKWCTVLFHKSF